jgi:hypothetical protein
MCFIHFADEVTAGPDGPTFWFDAADAGCFDTYKALISALLTGLTEAGLASGTLMGCRLGMRRSKPACGLPFI